MFGKKRDLFDTDVLLIVKREDGVTKRLTKARRVKMDDGTYFFEVKDPDDPKKVYNVQDFPTSDFTRDKFGVVVTFDMQQFSPARISFVNEDEVKLELLSGEQKEWFVRSIKRDYERMIDKSWWNQNKSFVMFIVTIAVVGLVLYFAYIKWGGLLSTNTSAVQELTKAIKTRPVVSSPSPPA